MRQLKKEDAIREYGVRFVPALDRLELDLSGYEGGLSPRDALAKKLEALSRSRFDGVIRLKEELGFVTQDFHFKDMQDVRDRYETQEREYYKKTFETLGGLMTSHKNMELLEQAAESDRPEQQRLKAAFDKANEKVVVIEQFLSSGGVFKVEVEPLKGVITLPDTIVEPGATVYVVKDDGKSIPALVEGTVGKRDFGAAFFSKADFSVSYEINTRGATTPASSPARDENRFFSIDSSKAGTPAGVVAKGLNQLAFNSKAGAAAHIGEVLDAREEELKTQMQQLRAARKQLGKTAP